MRSKRLFPPLVILTILISLAIAAPIAQGDSQQEDLAVSGKNAAAERGYSEFDSTSGPGLPLLPAVNGQASPSASAHLRGHQQRVSLPHLRAAGRRHGGVLGQEQLWPDQRPAGE